MHESTGVTVSPVHIEPPQIRSRIRVQILSGRRAGSIGHCEFVNGDRVGVRIEDGIELFSKNEIDLVIPDSDGYVTPYILAKLMMENRVKR